MLYMDIAYCECVWILDIVNVLNFELWGCKKIKF
jgi:hypothetical protein